MGKCTYCDSHATHQLLNYFVYPTPSGIKHLPLCASHAKEWGRLHPFSNAAVPVGKRS